MDSIEKLKESILRDYPRMKAEDRFCFECGSQVPCFNQCCADVNIFLSPYDVLRMSRRLGTSSSSFLARHTIVPFDKNQKLPVPLLQMAEPPHRTCPFVKAEVGCTIYSDRPWSCRMYPIGKASPASEPGRGFTDEEFFFMMKDDQCEGIGRPKLWSVASWIKDQGADDYEEFGNLFKSVTLHPRLLKGWTPTDKHIDMYWMALYDLDRFRVFITESSFLQRFELTKPEELEIANNDEALLKIGFRWIKTAFYGEPALKIRPQALNDIIARESKQKVSANG